MQYHFYATGQDLFEVCKEISRALPLQYMRAGLFATADPTALSHPALTELESAEPGEAFLLTPSDIPVKTRQISAIQGARFAIDELANPSSATLKLGSRPSPNVLTPGSIGTTAKAGLSAKIVRQFGKEMERQFVRVRAYWVGREALAMLKAGARLTLNEHSSPEFDLVLQGNDG